MNPENTKIQFANALRGFAAITVLISHHYGVFWNVRDVVATMTNSPVLSNEYFGTPKYINYLWQVPNFSWGLFGVALFFIISGFVIPYSIQKSSAAGFFVNRFFRLAPTYAVGFSITLLAIYISTKYFHTTWEIPSKDIVIHYFAGLRDIFGVKGLDGVIWTLEIEIKFYLVCLVSISLLKNYSKKIFFVPLGIFFFGIVLSKISLHGFLSGEIITRLTMIYLFSAPYIIFMFIGVLLHYLYIQKISGEYAIGIIGVLFFMFAILWSSGPYAASFSQIWNYALAFLIFKIAYCLRDFFKANKLSNFFADISYPLYVSHGIAGYVALRLLLEGGLKPSLALPLVTSLCIILAFIIHKLIEVPSQLIGKWCQMRLSNLNVNHA